MSQLTRAITFLVFSAVLACTAVSLLPIQPPVMGAAISVIVTTGLASWFLCLRERTIQSQQSEIEGLQRKLCLAEQERTDRAGLLANIGIEARKPLREITAISEMLTGEQVTPAQQAYLASLAKSVGSLRDEIDNLVEFSQCEAGSLQLKSAPFSIRDVISEISGALGLHAQSQGLEFAVHIQSRVPYELIGDEHRIQHILVNLVENAIEYTDHGEIVLRVALKSREEDRATLHLSVTDTGIGMTEADIASLFTGTQLRTMSSSTRGSLGLAVSEELVRLMSGEIWAESEIDRGSTFHFTLTLEIGSSDGNSTLQRTQLGLMPDVPVLVVQENQTGREILGEMLANLQMEPTLAENTDEAIDAIQSQLRRDKTFSVVIADANMSDTDGMQLCTRIKQIPSYAAIPVIMLINASRPEDGIRAIEAGAAATIEKPVKPSRLTRVLVSSMLGDGRYQQMRNDVQAAESYVRALIPPPIDSPIWIDWRYRPAADLAGDALGYHWIDEEHCAVYVLDVTGHGLDSALLSVSVLNVIKSMTLPDTDFLDPSAVLFQLNNRFPMESHGNRCFTMWYGVIDLSNRTIIWSGGGHPPAIVIGADLAVRQLRSQGPMLGMLEDAEFPSAFAALASDERIYIYSDGVFEIEKPDDSQWQFDEFVQFMSDRPDHESSQLDRLWDQTLQIRGSESLEDDFTIMEIAEIG